MGSDLKRISTGNDPYFSPSHCTLIFSCDEILIFLEINLVTFLDLLRSP